MSDQGNQLCSGTKLAALVLPWEVLPTRPRNDLALLMGSICEADVDHASAVVTFLLHMKCKWRMLPKDLRRRINEYPENPVFFMGKEKFL